MKLHAALAKGLRDHGVETVFGLMGDANLYLLDRYVRDEGGRYIGTAHEAGAVLMSYGYARRSGKLGVSTTTHGPGVTNTVTALTEGVRANTPMLLVCGDSTVDKNPLQGINLGPVVASSEAGYELVKAPDKTLVTLSRAIRRAYAELRPIVYSVPTEWMWEEIEYERIPANVEDAQAIRPDLDAVDYACGVIAAARKPIVLMGFGVSAAARPHVLALAERIGAPVATTLAAKGGAAGEPFGLGVFGTFSSELGTETFLSADCIIAFGASLNRYTSAGGSLTKDKAIIHCDINPLAIGKNITPTAGVVGDAGVVAEAMLELIEAAEIPRKDFRTDELRDRIAASDDFADFKDLGTDHDVDLRVAMRRINAVVPKHRNVVSDGGRVMGPPLRMLDVNDPGAFNLSLGFGAIGLGTATAVGTAVAAPDVPTVLAVGDGSFMSAGFEFNTAVRENLDLIVVLANDQAYGAEHMMFRRKEMDPTLSTFNWPDFAPIADALGGRGITVRNNADLDLAEKAIADRDRPLLIDLKLDPDHIPWLL